MLAVDDAALSPGSAALRLVAVAVLVAANGLFVAAEFALVASRRSKLQQMASEGNRGARLAEQSLLHIDRYISATQLGITLASLALGWLGEPAIASLIDSLLDRLGFIAERTAVHSGASIVAGFTIITFLHLIFGEVTPKAIALVDPERAASWLIWPLVQFSRVTKPVIVVLNASSNALLRLLGLEPPTGAGHVHSPEEVRMIVVQARDHGTLDESDTAMLEGIFDFRQKKARDVMRPRTEAIGIPVEATEDEVWAILRRERYSRYPVYADTMDDVVGVLVAKDFWLREPDAPFALRAMMREPQFIPDVRPAERVLDDLRRSRAHLAVVLDEYGGTAGIITMEDLVEEVVGDIADEYDLQARDSMELDGVLELAGSLSLVDVRSDHQVRVPPGDWTTLGGYVFSALGRLPKIGDRVVVPGAELEVVAMDGRRVAALRINRLKG